jgi:ribosomal protein S18 acetylase RimI-like enzyme
MDETTPIRIRRARYRDWKPLSALLQNLFPKFLPAPVVSYVVRRSFPLIGLAESPSALVGCYVFNPENDEQTGTALLSYMGVIASHRHAGVGTLLLRAFETHARELGYRCAVLAVHDDNHAAIRLYEREGFSRQGTDPEPGKLRFGKPFPGASAIQPHEPRDDPATRLFRRVAYWYLVDSGRSP